LAADGWQVSAVWAAWTTVAIYLILGIFALVQVLQARTLRESQARQAREIREAEARPYVVVDFEPEEPPFVNLVIANLGRTMARNVRLEVDPPFDSSVYRSGPVPLARFKLFTEGIRLWRRASGSCCCSTRCTSGRTWICRTPTACGSPTSGMAGRCLPRSAARPGSVPATAAGQEAHSP
jgi:hypothetical protein